MASRNKPGCNCCGPCTANCTDHDGLCDQDALPCEYQIEFTGVVDGVFCVDCEYFNTTTFILSTVIGSGLSCKWEVLDDSACELNNVQLHFYADGGGVHTIEVLLAFDGFSGGSVRFIKTFAPAAVPISCNGLVDEAIPYSSTTQTLCNFTGATAYVTAIA